MTDATELQRYDYWGRPSNDGDLCQFTDAQAVIVGLRQERDDAKADYARWHTAYMDYRYGSVGLPEGAETTIDRLTAELTAMREEVERLTAGLQLMATDEHRLMNECARQTAASILGGKNV